ncbi:MAG: twin-arginine translocase TatA/TatE family subunit [Chthoniobacteraceae bacterium]|nr:twin-arginine translocase TatA/TatE family subunit [Chthoniobacteraceae bacterium]
MIEVESRALFQFVFPSLSPVPIQNARCKFALGVLVQPITAMNILASLFNLAGPDLIIILLIVLLLFGAKKLPELARGMGQAVREFSKAKDEFEREVTRPVIPEPAKIEEPRTEMPRTDMAHDLHEFHPRVETPKVEHPLDQQNHTPHV